MMICPQCQTANQPENKFCRECGASLHPAAVPSLSPASPQTIAEEDRTIPLPPMLADQAAIPLVPPSADEQVQIQERAAHLMAEAASLEQRGWYADATARAEKASLLLPGALAPLSLLVGLYEAQGDRNKALAMQERIIRAYPDVPSELSRAERLRQEARAARIAAAESHSIKSILPHASPVKSEVKAEKPLPYLPLAVAGGVAALIFCAGISLMGKQRGATPQITETTLPASNAPLNAPSALGTNVNPNFTTSPQGAPAESRPDPFARQGATNFSATPTPGFVPPTAPTRRNTPAANPNARSGSRGPTLPFPNSALAVPGQVNNGGVRFVAPAPVTVVEGASNSNGQRIIARPPTELAPGPNTSGVNTSNSAPAAPEDPGYIRIQVNPAPNPPANSEPPASGGENGSGGSDTENVGASNGSALSRARRMQDQGRYAEAIAAYREAISGMTMPPGDAYQGLALSYQRKGNKIAARSGYQKAIRSYEVEMSAGQRSLVAQRGLEACRAALEVLGG